MDISIAGLLPGDSACLQSYNQKSKQAKPNRAGRYVWSARSVPGLASVLLQSSWQDINPRATFDTHSYKKRIKYCSRWLNEKFAQVADHPRTGKDVTSRAGHVRRLIRGQAWDSTRSSRSCNLMRCLPFLMVSHHTPSASCFTAEDE